jgi:type VI secretion system protein VasJ
MDLLSLGKEPVSPDRPAGADIRYDPLFEDLQAEVDKLSSPTAEGALDWTKVVTLSAQILGTKSKDLLAASYLAVGLIHTRKIEGLASGLTVYRDLLETHWEGLFPPKARMRGRVGAIAWWLEKAEPALAQLPRVPPDGETLARLQESVDRIDRFFRENLDEPPSLSPLAEFVGALGPLAEERAAREGPPEGAGEAVSRSEPAPAREHAAAREPAGVAFPATVTSPEEADAVLELGLAKIGEVADVLRESDPAAPLAYRLARTAIWSAVESLPPATDGRTAVPPPAAHVALSLKEMAGQGNDEGLLALAEGALPQNVFWLDLSRRAAEALSRLGDRFEAAHRAVCHETAAFARRLPGLELLAFADGTPFADAETQAWLARIGPAAGPDGEGAAAAAEGQAPADEDAALRQAVKECRGLVRKGKLLDAAERFRPGLSNGSRSRRLRWRLALAELLLGSKHTRLALPHLDLLLEEVGNFRLEDYDPDLALMCLKAAWTGFSAHPDQVPEGRAEEMLRRIARLDLAEAIRLEKEE